MQALENSNQDKIKVLFLCTGNSCRSQMAEGLCRELRGDLIEPYSAGVETHGLNPHAVSAMQEIGVDISHHRSKTVDEIGDVRFDFVIAVCGHAQQTCPVFPAESRVVLRQFDDPPRLAAEEADPESGMTHYRRVRDEIRDYVSGLPDTF